MGVEVLANNREKEEEKKEEKKKVNNKNSKRKRKVKRTSLLFDPNTQKVKIKNKKSADFNGTTAENMRTF